MGIRKLWTVWGILCLMISLVSCFYPEYYVEDLCKIGNETIVYDTSRMGSVGILKTTSRPPYKPNKNCTIVLKPPADKGIVLSVRQIDMRERSYICQDFVKVFHSDFITSPTVLCRFQFDLKEKISFYTKGPMTVIYHVGPRSYSSFSYEKGFSLVYTTASEDIQDCIGDNMYMCGNGRCVLKDVTCDGHNNCGDRTDESSELCDSNLLPYLRMTDYVYIIVFSILILSIVLFGIFAVNRRRRRRFDSDSSSDTDEAMSRWAQFQAVHPAGFAISQNPAGPSLHSKALHHEGGFANPCYSTGMPPPPPPYSQ